MLSFREFITEQTEDHRVDSLPSHPMMGDKFVHTDDVGLSRSSHGGSIKLPNITKKLLKSSPTEKLSIHDAHVGQTYLNRERVKHYLGNPEGSETPVAVKHEGKHYVVDGHHRLAAAKLKGETHLNFKVISPK